MSDIRAFDPEAILRALEEHGVAYVLIGGLAASLHGSPHVTTDVDVAPSRERENLARLARALVSLDARVRAPDAPDGLPFDRSAEALARSTLLNLTTRHGDLDLTFEPAGTSGYEDLRRHALEISVHGTRITIAALADVIRSKQASDREKDRLALPALRELLARSGGRR